MIKYEPNFMESNMDIDNAGSDGAASAVSIFGQGQGANDFPVLKAFQEYIDAEQAKARKRMLGLSIFFVVLLVIVVITFTVIVAGVINRNQALQDRLLEAAFRQQQTPVAQPQPVVNVQQPQSAQPDMRPVLDKIEQLATAIANQPHPVPVAAQPAPSVSEELKPVLESIARLTSAVSRPQPVAPAQVVVAPAPVQPDQKTLEIKKQLERERAQIAAERRKLKEEQHQAEVERNRRRLYPEYYARKDAEKAEKGAVKKANSPSSPTAGKPDASTPAPLPADSGNLETIKPVGYFNQNAAAEDAELAALAAQAAKRRAASDAARRQAEADEAEAAKRKAAANAAKKQSEAATAEAAKAKAAAEAAKAKADAQAAEAAKRKAAADAERKRVEAELAETQRAKAEADKRKAEAEKVKAEREFPPPPQTETISVGGKDSSVPWIIQRLSE